MQWFKWPFKIPPGFGNGGKFSELEVFQRGSSLESSSRGRRKGIGEEPIAEAEGSSVRVREVRRANVVVDGDGGA